MSLTPADIRSARKLVITGFIVIVVGMLLVISGRSPGLGAVGTVLREKCAEKYRDAQTLADTMRADNFVPEPGLQGRYMQRCSFFRPFLRHRAGFRKSAPSQSTSFPAAAQRADTLHLRVGSPEVRGTSLKPFSDHFTGYREYCDEPTRIIGDEFDLLELAQSSRGSTWRYVVTMHYPDGGTFVDTCLYDRRTLAPISARYHSTSTKGFDGFDVADAHVSWFSVGGEGSQRLDTTLAESAFLEGSGDLLIRILANVVVANHVVDWPVINLGASESHPQPRLVIDRATARPAGISVPRPKGVPAGSISIDLGGGAYVWLSATGHEVIAKQLPTTEVTSASVYLRSELVKRLSPKVDSNPRH
jgi:hypothetical protein